MINKQIALLNQPRQLFHTKDLALLWDIENKNTLRVTISRYLHKGLLHQIQRGLYSTVPPENIDPVVLARAMIHGYCYLSLEHILAVGGAIMQWVYAITFVGERAQDFMLPGHNQRVVVLSLSRRYLFNPIGIKGGEANLSRAVADKLYYSPHYYFDAGDSGIINWKEVKAYELAIGYKPHDFT